MNVNTRSTCHSCCCRCCRRSLIQMPLQHHVTAAQTVPGWLQDDGTHGTQAISICSDSAAAAATAADCLAGAPAVLMPSPAQLDWQTSHNPQVRCTRTGIGARTGEEQPGGFRSEHFPNVGSTSEGNEDYSYRYGLEHEIKAAAATTKKYKRLAPGGNGGMTGAQWATE